MNIGVTEKEINDRGWWKKYSEIKGRSFYGEVADVVITFTESEYDQLRGIIPVKIPLTKTQEKLKNHLIKVKEKCNGDNLYELVRFVRNNHTYFTLGKISDIIDEVEK